MKRITKIKIVAIPLTSNEEKKLNTKKNLHKNFIYVKIVNA